MVSKLKQGVEDLSISRATLKWGIPMPNDPDHVVYVWIDALSNYITALGYGSGDQSLFDKFWPANVHLIGKEILWFHTVYWPAILFSLNLRLPKKVFAHGWWTSGGKKMSKSMGNFIDLVKMREVIGTYSLDALRYYMLRAAPFGSDLDWTDADFLKSFNELKNVVGNCLNRTLKMIDRYRGGVLPAAGDLQQIDRDLLSHAREIARPQLADAYDRIELAAVRGVAGAIGAGDEWIHRFHRAVQAGEGSCEGRAIGYGAECGGAVDSSCADWAAPDSSEEGG